LEDVSPDIEELTAYLDGELDQVSLERVEARLGSDPAYLNQMQAIQQTWDLLDWVPGVEPHKSFTRTTMELAFGYEVKQRKGAASSWTWVLRAVVLVAIPVVLFAGSYTLTRNKLKQPDQILLENLSVIDHHPYYTIARNDNQFVDGLLELFAGTNELGAELTLQQQEDVEVFVLPDELDARRAYVESLGAEEKLLLEKQMNEFFNKPEAKQNALKEFDREVRSRDDAKERLHVLSQYYEWLRGLKPEERTAVMGLQVDQCLAKIEQIRNLQATNKLGIAGLSDLPDHDVELVFGWYDAVCAQARGNLRERFANVVSKYAKEQGRKPASGMLRVAKRGYFPRLVKVLLQLDRKFVEKTVLRDGNLELLDLMLSAESKEVLYSLDSDQQKKLVFQWFESANQAKFDVRPEELYKFEKSLDSQLKRQLRSQDLSSEEYIGEIRRLYREKHEPDKPSAIDAQWEALLEQLQSQ